MRNRIEDRILIMLDTAAGWCRVIFWLAVGLVLYAILSCTLNGAPWKPETPMKKAAKPRPTFDENLALSPASAPLPPLPPLPPGFEATESTAAALENSVVVPPPTTAATVASNPPPAVEFDFYCAGTDASGQRWFALDLALPAGGILQTSTNLVDWTDIDWAGGGIYAPNLVIAASQNALAADGPRFFRKKPN